MVDLIERQAAIDATWEEPTYIDPINVLTEVRDRIKMLPSAEPEWKIGKWIRYSPSLFECPFCGAFDYGGNNYCPNCGTRMAKA